MLVKLIGPTLLRTRSVTLLGGTCPTGRNITGASSQLAACYTERGFIRNTRFAQSWGKTIQINAQLNVKTRGSYLSEKKGNVLSGFLKEAGFASSLAIDVLAQASI